MSGKNKKRAIFFIAFFALLSAEVLIALFGKGFVRAYIGDVLAVILVYCLGRMFFPESPKLMSLIALGVAFAIELLQLTPLSEHLAEPFATILGGTFDFADLLCYAVGGAVCFVIDAKKNAV